MQIFIRLRSDFQLPLSGQRLFLCSKTLFFKILSTDCPKILNALVTGKDDPAGQQPRKERHQ